MSKAQIVQEQQKHVQKFRSNRIPQYCIEKPLKDSILLPGIDAAGVCSLASANGGDAPAFALLRRSKPRCK